MAETTDSPAMSILLKVPNEIILSIAAYLNHRWLNSLSQTCRQLHQLLDANLYTSSLDATRDGLTVLSWAARKGSLPLMKRLLAHVPTGYLNSMRKEACLIEATGGGHEDIVRFLLDLGADPFSREVHLYCYKFSRWHPNALDPGRGSAFSSAVCGWKAGVVKIMIEYDPEKSLLFLRELIQNCPWWERSSMLELLVPFIPDLHLSEENWGTMLRRVAHAGSVEATKALLDAGGSIESHARALSIALQEAAENGRYDVVKLLVERGAPINDVNGYGETPLHLAVHSGDRSIVTFLLATGANVRILDPEGESALHYAVTKDDPEIVKMLLKVGASPTVCVRRRDSPLLFALYDRKREEYQILLEAEGRDWEKRYPPEYLHIAFNINDYVPDERFQNTLGAQPGWARNPEIRSMLRAMFMGSRCDEGRNPGNAMALCKAALLGATKVVRLLLERGADVNTVDKFSRTPLIYAAMFGHRDTVMELLAMKPAAINHQDQELRSALGWAVENGDIRVVETLLDAGANIEIDGKVYGLLSFRRAVEKGHLEVTDLLLSRYMSTEGVDMDGESPLFWAVRGANPSADILRLLITKGAAIEARGTWERTPLFQAVANQHEGIVDILLEAGADQDVRDHRGITPLVESVRLGNAKILKRLLDAPSTLDTRAELNRKIIPQEQDPVAWEKKEIHQTLYTPLFWAAMNGYEYLVKLLLDRGIADPTVDKFGRTPLMIAAVRGHADVADALLERSAEVNCVDFLQRTPLSVAAETGNVEMVELLLAHQADVDRADVTGRTPLSWAAQMGNKEVASMLVEAGAEVTKGDRRGRTPLWWALEYGHERLIKSLTFEVRVT